MLTHKSKAARSASTPQPSEPLSGLDEASLRELREAGLLQDFPEDEGLSGK